MSKNVQNETLQLTVSGSLGCLTLMVNGFRCYGKTLDNLHIDN
jgi:hypothetical protein